MTEKIYIAPKGKRTKTIVIEAVFDDEDNESLLYGALQVLLAQNEV